MAAPQPDVNTLVALLAFGSSFAKQRLEGFYKSSKSLEGFPIKVSTLNAKLEHWNYLLIRFGTSEGDLLLPTVAAIEDATRWLEKEEDRLQAMQGRCCFRCKSKAVFPDEFTDSFQKVIDSIDAVPMIRTAAEEALEELKLARQRRLDSISLLPFSADSKYVPLKRSLMELQNALETENEFQVVTLYGPAGLGKSMMVQYLALHYQEARRNSRDDQDIDEISSIRFPDGVFYMDCGPDADSRAKHLELLNNLGSRPEQMEIGAGQDAQIHSDYDIHKRLCSRLAFQSVLIILDDVWNPELIQQLLVPGNGIKYLITSQIRGVWEDAYHVRIQLPSLEEARIILANYIGGMPPRGMAGVQLQEMAEEVIHASDFNPLVIANWGLALKGESSADPSEWTAAKEELFDTALLEYDEEILGPAGFGNLKHPRTAASSTMMAIDVLPSEAQTLLLLTALCSGPSVPEQVLKSFFEYIHGTRRRLFQKWRNQLEDRSFIQVQFHPVPWRSIPIRTWSINRLRQHFIRKVKKEAVSFLIQSILEGNNPDDADLVISLAAIYGVEELRLGASKKLGLDIRQNITVWRCVEPFVWLLELEGGEEWEKECLQCAKEVIFQYICKGKLAQHDLLRLLYLPETNAAACWAVELMAWNWSTLTLWGTLSDTPQATPFKWTSKNKGAISVFQGVLESLKNDVDACTQRMAANALVAFAWASHDISLPAASTALGELVSLLARNASAIVQEAAARALGRLAHLKGHNSHDISVVGEYSGVVEGLVRLLGRNVSPSVHIAAAEALYFISGDISSATKLIGTRGALQKLADLLGNNTNSDVQQFAALTLYNLSCHREMDSAHDMKGGFGYSIGKDRLTLSSSVHGAPLKKPNTQTRKSIIAVPGMLRGLVGLLRDDVRPVVQMLAASTIKRLSEVEANRLGIAKFPGAMEGLSRMLRSQGLGPLGLDVIAQAEAAKTLVVLAEVDGNIKLVPGLVEGLKALLASDVHPYVQESVARCFTIIDPIRANQIMLYSGVAYRARANANIHIGLFREALEDLESLEDLEPENQQNFHELLYVKAMLEDFDGSLLAANTCIQQAPDAHFYWAERGVIKRMMRDYEGALEDLNKALKIAGVTVQDYLKQRGYVKYLMGDEIGAESDATAAINFRSRIDSQSSLSGEYKFSLSELSVAYLGHAL